MHLPQTTKKITRRDFLKIAGGALTSAFVSQTLPFLRRESSLRPNIILIVMDAFSARHASLYGYPRQTTPNIEAFAQTSSVYHRHYSGGNFTTPGTASMLTGMLPWTHGAVAGGGLVRPKFVDNNIFSLLGNEYYRFAFLQNTWADRLVGQYPQDVERFLSPFSYSRMSDSPLLLNFENDRALASASINDFLFSLDGSQKIPGSAIFGYLSKSQRDRASLSKKNITTSYPKGFPFAMNGIVYRNEEIYDGVYTELEQLHNQNLPYFAYFHLFSPHGDYKPRSDYRKRFNDKYKAVNKPDHPLYSLYSDLFPHKTGDLLQNQRTLYDSLIAQIDDEFGKLLARLKEKGALDNSYLILTSDHGELFERGFFGHGDFVMYEGGVHIPLVIHAPGQTQRKDVFTLTSNIDILPTLLAISGKVATPETAGKILPGFSADPVDESRPVFTVHARDNSIFSPLTKTAISMRKREYKIIAYLKYATEAIFELYDIENDPEELNDLSSQSPKTLSDMKDELFTRLNEANRMFTD